MKMATNTMANKFSDDPILVLVSNAMDDLQQQTLILYPISIETALHAPGQLHLLMHIFT